MGDGPAAAGSASCLTLCVAFEIIDRHAAEALERGDLRFAAALRRDATKLRDRIVTEGPDATA